MLNKGSLYHCIEFIVYEVFSCALCPESCSKLCKYCYYHFVDKRLKAQAREVTCLGSANGKKVAEPEPGSPTSKYSSLCSTAFEFLRMSNRNSKPSLLTLIILFYISLNKIFV